jgi:putative colanic acid biosynthesis UDP-glucose lipid carrier transferase
MDAPVMPIEAPLLHGYEQSHADGNFPLLRWTYGLINRLVMGLDAGSILLASLLTWMVGNTSGLMLTSLQAGLIAVLEAAAFFWTLFRLRAYRVEHYTRLVAPLVSVLMGLVVAWSVGGLYLAAFATHSGNLSQVLAQWFLPQVPALFINRQVVRGLVHWIGRRGWLRRRTILIGANQVGEVVLDQMQAPGQAMNFDIIGVFANLSDERRAGMMGGIPIGEIDSIAEFARHNVIDLIVVALPLPRAAQFIAVMEHLQWIAADVVIPMGDIGMQQQSVRPAFARVTDIAGMSTLQVMHRPLKGSQAVLKILQDYVVASVALLLAGPVMLVAAIAIRLDSPGPVFFRQKRTGFNNKPFSIYKFRTMTVDPSDDGSLGTRVRNDPRITRVGRILRTLSIDELPQLFNVLSGDMSIVGPRPYVPNMLVGSELFHGAIRNFAFRYRMKPGITGLAQASGLRSNALRSKDNARRSVELDIQYIMNWSLWLDLRIMVRTLLMAMTGPEVF